MQGLVCFARLFSFLNLPKSKRPRREAQDSLCSISAKNADILKVSTACGVEFTRRDTWEIKHRIRFVVSRRATDPLFHLVITASRSMLRFAIRTLAP
jgi:hypothetical protein